MAKAKSVSEEELRVIPGRCPRCGQARIHAYRPFCSKRCRDLDLGAWLDERYTVPVVEEPGGDYEER